MSNNPPPDSSAASQAPAPTPDVVMTDAAPAASSSPAPPAPPVTNAPAPTEAQQHLDTAAKRLEDLMGGLATADALRQFNTDAKAMWTLEQAKEDFLKAVKKLEPNPDKWPSPVVDRLLAAKGLLANAQAEYKAYTAQKYANNPAYLEEVNRAIENLGAAGALPRAQQVFASKHDEEAAVVNQRTPNERLAEAEKAREAQNDELKMEKRKRMETETEFKKMQERLDVLEKRQRTDEAVAAAMPPAAGVATISKDAAASVHTRAQPASAAAAFNPQAAFSHLNNFKILGKDPIINRYVSNAPLPPSIEYVFRETGNWAKDPLANQETYQKICLAYAQKKTALA